MNISKRLRVLLIGGTGVLSTDIMLLSLKKGYDVYILNRGYSTKVLPQEVKFLKANVNIVEELNNAVGSLTFDVVVDFLSRKTTDIYRIYSVFKDICNQYIFISTACVYSRSFLDGIITESSPKPNVDWSYGIEKYNCERLIAELAGNEGKIYTIVRPYITYGNTRIPFGLAPAYGFHWTLIGRILNDKPFFVWDNGNAICTLTHTQDFAVGVVGLFNNEKAYNEDFHITCDETHTWKEMLQLLYKILGKQENIIEIPSKYIISKLPEYKELLLGDRALNAKFDNSKIKNVVPDFNATITLEEGLKQTINFYIQHGYLDGIDYFYDAKIDKMIAAYCCDNHIQKKYKVKFIDYIDENSIKQYLRYQMYRFTNIEKVKPIFRKFLFYCKIKK